MSRLLITTWNPECGYELCCVGRIQTERIPTEDISTRLHILLIKCYLWRWRSWIHLSASVTLKSKVISVSSSARLCSKDSKHGGKNLERSGYEGGEGEREREHEDSENATEKLKRNAAAWKWIVSNSPLRILQSEKQKWVRSALYYTAIILWKLWFLSNSEVWKWKTPEKTQEQEKSQMFLCWIKKKCVIRKRKRSRCLFVMLKCEHELLTLFSM